MAVTAAKLRVRAMRLADMRRGRKLCSSCGAEKDRKDFHKKSSSPDGLVGSCRSCVKKIADSRYGKQRYTKYRNSENGKKVRKAYRNSSRGKEAANKYLTGKGRLANTLRARFRMALKKGARAGSAVRDLGCTIAEFRLYIEALWEPGMSWANWGKGPGTWQIDHRRPLASFDLTKREQVKEACLFINLQPLWHEDHVKKTTNQREVGGG